MEKRIMKVAYKMPPQENWNAFRDEKQTNENHITEKDYQAIIDAGFTHGMGLLEHGAEIAERALQVAEKVGLKYYVRDAVNWANILHPDYYYYNRDNYEKYAKYSSFAGLYVYDEPNANKYPDLAKMVQGYYDFFKGIGEPLVNLLPTYANEVEQLGAKNYEEYIEKYIQTVPTNYVLYDHYPFRVKNKVEEYLSEEYLYNCDVVAKACKKGGKQLRTFIQSAVMDNGKIELLPEIIDFQIHTHLAYGSRAIIYYYYWGDENRVDNKSGLVNWDGEPTELYYRAKKVHAEISEYEDKLCESKWQKTLYFKGQNKHLNEKEFSHFEIDNSNKFVFSYDGIVGLFDYKGKEAYYLVNYTNPRLGLENEVELNLDGDYYVWVGGQKAELKKGVNKITIPCGRGAFLLPIMKN